MEENGSSTDICIQSKLKKENIMFKIVKISLITLICVNFGVLLLAENHLKSSPPPSPPGGKYKEKYDTNFELYSSDVDKAIHDFKVKLKAEIKGEKMPSTLMGSYAYKFKIYSMHPKIEEETGVYKSWYSDIAKCLTLMSRCKAEFYTAKANNDPEEMQKYVMVYKKKLKQCIQLLKNPKKIEKKDREKSRRKRSTKKHIKR
jgi:hypothetical protein